MRQHIRRNIFRFRYRHMRQRLQSLIRVVQIPRIVRKVFIRQPNRYAVFGDALLRDERDEFLFLPIPVDTDKSQ